MGDSLVLPEQNRRIFQGKRKHSRQIPETDFKRKARWQFMLTGMSPGWSAVGPSSQGGLSFWAAPKQAKAGGAQQRGKRPPETQNQTNLDVFVLAGSQPIKASWGGPGSLPGKRIGRCQRR